MGRRRKDETDKMGTVTINLKQGTIDRIAKEGKPKHVIEKLVREKYEKPH